MIGFRFAFYHLQGYGSVKIALQNNRLLIRGGMTDLCCDKTEIVTARGFVPAIFSFSTTLIW